MSGTSPVFTGGAALGVNGVEITLPVRGLALGRKTSRCVSARSRSNRLRRSMICDMSWASAAEALTKNPTTATACAASRTDATMITSSLCSPSTSL